jgi:hypothetical protein
VQGRGVPLYHYRAPRLNDEQARRILKNLWRNVEGYGEIRRRRVEEWVSRSPIPRRCAQENMRLRAEGTIVVTKRALAAAKPRAFIEFAEKTLALEEWARRFNARGLKFRLFGAPRTKKNHSRLKWAPKKKRTVLVPSAAYEEWCNHVCVQLATMREPLPDLHYNCAAVFYRDADRGDAVGYYQGLADALEAAGV